MALLSGVRPLGAVLFVCRRSRRLMEFDHFILAPQAGCRFAFLTSSQRVGARHGAEHGLGASLAALQRPQGGFGEAIRHTARGWPCPRARPQGFAGQRPGCGSAHRKRSESGESGLAGRLKSIQLALLPGVRSLGAMLFVCRRSRWLMKLDHFILAPQARDGNNKA